MRSCSFFVVRFTTSSSRVSQPVVITSSAAMAGAIRRTVRAASGMKTASKSTIGACWLRSWLSALRRR